MSNDGAESALPITFDSSKESKESCRRLLCAVVSFHIQLRRRAGPPDGNATARENIALVKRVEVTAGDKR